jgi:hypothetical protein
MVRVLAVSAVVLGGSLGSVLSGCSAEKPAASGPLPDNSLAAMAEVRQPLREEAPKPRGLSAADAERLAEEQARIMQDLASSGVVAPDGGVRPAVKPAPVRTGVVGAPLREDPPPPREEPAPSSGLAALAGEQGAERPESAPTAPAPSVPPAVGDRINLHADELAKALRERSLTSRDPVVDYLALAWLESIRPGVMGPLDSGPAARQLDPRQARTVGVLRDVAVALVSQPANVSDPERAWSAVEAAAGPVLSARDLKITTAELCTKVEGFGQYTPLGGRAMLAGTSHTMIVYVEVDHFSLRKETGPDGMGRHAVELAQSVEVWQDADRPTLQRRWPETTIVDVSRRERRDFFLTTVIELPPNLSVGAYTLKVSVRDRVKGALAEAVIPFRIVADAALADVK